MTQPATDLTHYVSKFFAMLDLCIYIIRQSNLHERVAAENILKFNDLPQSFLCDNYLESIKFINRTICNVFDLLTVIKYLTVAYLNNINPTNKISFPYHLSAMLA